MTAAIKKAAVAAAEARMLEAQVEAKKAHAAMAAAEARVAELEGEQEAAKILKRLIYALSLRLSCYSSSLFYTLPAIHHLRLVLKVSSYFNICRKRLRLNYARRRQRQKQKPWKIGSPRYLM